MTQAPCQADPFAGLPAIFRDCADPEAQRWDLSRPWRDGRYVYATDGRIAVRMLADALECHVAGAIPLRNKVGRQPDAAEPFAAFDEVEPEVLSLPSVLTGRRTCENCHGTGREADPEMVIALGPDCYLCSGVGTFPDWHPYEVTSGYWLSGRVIALLCRHDVTARRCRVGLGELPPVSFTGDGFEGLAMPCTSPKGNEPAS